MNPTGNFRRLHAKKWGVLARRRRDQLPFDHRLPSSLQDASPVEKTDDPLGRDAAMARAEAALFIADEPLTPRKLVAAADLADVAEARRMITRLKSLYDRDGTAFQVEDIAGGWQLRTRAAFHHWLVRLRKVTPDPKLSGPAMETLAIIAYRQPIVRADVEKIRGVQCGDVLRHLMERGLVRITGRDHTLGRPVLYGTTKKFLQVFGLNSLDDLPEIEQLRSGRDG